MFTDWDWAAACVDTAHLCDDAVPEASRRQVCHLGSILLHLQQSYTMDTSEGMSNVFVGGYHARRPNENR